MWYPAKVTVPVGTELITLDQARLQCRIGTAETHFDGDLARLVKAVRAHTEFYCGTRIGTQTIVARCDSFADMARLSEAPIQSVTSIEYPDPTGEVQTLPDAVYDVRDDGLEAAIVLKPAQSWPSVQPRTRITLTAVVGFSEVTEDVRHAMLLLLGHWFKEREAINVGNIVSKIPHAFDDLLANHRRYL